MVMILGLEVVAHARSREHDRYDAVVSGVACELLGLGSDGGGRTKPKNHETLAAERDCSKSSSKSKTNLGGKLL